MSFFSSFFVCQVFSLFFYEKSFESKLVSNDLWMTLLFLIFFFQLKISQNDTKSTIPKTPLWQEYILWWSSFLLKLDDCLRVFFLILYQAIYQNVTTSCIRSSQRLYSTQPITNKLPKCNNILYQIITEVIFQTTNQQQATKM